MVEPAVYGDDRGFFLESFNEKEMRKIGIDAHFVQDNHSRSGRNVLRGLHYQLSQPQGKLVRVVTGKVFDVVVDLRRNSRRLANGRVSSCRRRTNGCSGCLRGLPMVLSCFQTSPIFSTRRPTITRHNLSARFSGTIRT